MKSFTSILFSLCVLAACNLSQMAMAQQGNVGIGTTNPDPSALLDLSSLDQGLLIPRLTTTEIKNISSPAEGLMLYNTTSNCLWLRKGTDWIEICNDGTVGPIGPKGEKGDIGQSGPQGIEGEKGDTGNIGPKGIQGDKGDIGLAGDMGLQGIKGEKGDIGESGIKGTKGDQGDIGPTGMTGPQGINGNQGEQGDMGPRGPKGEKGETGVTGLTGPEGIKGDQGDIGLTGPKGETGDKGDTGLTGTTGPQGLKGNQGNTGDTEPKGEAGDKGDIGLTGPIGPQGIQGEKGETGDTGAQGAKGDKGDMGQTGVIGSQGIKGDRGDVGDTGPKGEKGEKGDIGLTGPIGLQGDEGLKGDQGDQGSKGDQGEKGDMGLTGIVGAQGIKGEKGEMGNIGLKGPKGDKGDMGLSGAVGLQGGKGDKGDIGDQGLKGDNGEKGEIGLTGLVGAQGLKGEKGEIGDIGIKGIKGDQGDIGPTGVAGQQGIKGEKGDLGDSGMKGDKGEIGDIGLTGLVGAQGLKGEIGDIGLKGDSGDGGDQQDLSISGNELSVTNDSSPVDLSSYLDNTDAQNLSLSNEILSISNGNSVDLSFLSNIRKSGKDIVIESNGEVNLGLNRNTLYHVNSIAPDTTLFDHFKIISGTYRTLSLGDTSTALTLFGWQAGHNTPYDGSDSKAYNVYIGNAAGFARRGSENSLIGYGVGRSGGDGLNTAFGSRSLWYNSGGISNVALGYQSGRVMRFTSYTVAVGARALEKTRSLPENIAIGYRAGYDSQAKRSIYIGNNTATTNTTSDRIFILNYFMGEFNNKHLRIGIDTEITGTVGVKTSSPTSDLSVNGTAGKPGGGNWDTFSDRRMKKDIFPFEDGLEAILKIQPKTFQYNGKGFYQEDGKVHIGIIAQEIDTIAPYMIEKVIGKLNPDDLSDTELLKYDPTALSYLLINAIKDRQKIIEVQHLKLQEQEEKTVKLNDDAKALEARLETVNNLLNRINSIEINLKSSTD